jgi:hypothetical protein
MTLKIYPEKKLLKYQEGFRILKQYQIEEIFWREANQSKTSEYRNQLWDAIHETKARRKYDISSGTLKHRRKAAAIIIKENLDKETFNNFKQDGTELTSVEWEIIWKSITYIISQTKFGNIFILLVRQQ